MPSHFITNAPTRTLKRRLHELISTSRELKFLVGFFYFSGWQELYAALKERDGLILKVLVGLDVERILGQAVAEVGLSDDSLSNAELAQRFFRSLNLALNRDEMDTETFYEQVAFFIRLLEEGRLHIRKTLRPNHAKLYLFKVKDEHATLLPMGGKFITGSSNLTRAGLLGQDEFNVEIGDYGMEEAEAYFDALWEEAVPITEVPAYRERLVRLIRRGSLAADVHPFEAYAFVLKTYLDMVQQAEIKPYLERILEARGYRSYTYQREAVQQALKIIENYHGVILADVVGLGKSVIAALVGKHLGKRGMVLCPPGLMGDKKATFGWRKYLHDFELYDWEVWSHGKLEEALDYLNGAGRDIEVIVVDEAHRFRNQDTQAYEHLSLICRNRNVILLTATPFNNSPADIFALLKLFLVPGKSALGLDDDLEARFSRYDAEFRRLAYISRYHNAGGKAQERAQKYYEDLFGPGPIQLSKVRQRSRLLARHIREVLEPVLIRRNRIDLQRDPVYAREIPDLPKVADPIELFFELTPEQSAFYDRVVSEYFGEEGKFTGAIYQPFVYELPVLDVDELDLQTQFVYFSQRNLYDFMRRLLVKRFESSFGAFKQSIENFIRVHQRVLAFIGRSGGRYVLDRRLIEKMHTADPEEVDKALAQFAEKLSGKPKRSKYERIYDTNKFAHKDRFLKDIQADLTLLERISREIESLGLVEVTETEDVIEDPKARKLIEALSEMRESTPKKGEPRRKIVIFSEYADTVRYLRPILERAFPGRVLTMDGRLTATLERQILENFDASVPPKQQKDNFDILLTTDKLSEGVNLNRAGAVINYDIPWNPTRVIQRVGRINRISRKVFETLYIYNFFPTEQGADYVKSRQIAAQKMFLIHNTLGEDAKIFAVDEEPSPSELYRRLNRSPEEDEEPSLLTSIRQRWEAVCALHPDIEERVRHFPTRIKTAKAHSQHQVLVFRRKNLSFFFHGILDMSAEKAEPQPLSLEEALPLVECRPDTKRLPLSPSFWPAYEAIKKYREIIPTPKAENTLEVQAMNNLRSALRHPQAQFSPGEREFMRLLLEDLRTYKTFPKYTLRRLVEVDLSPSAKKEDVEAFRQEINYLRRYLGDTFLNAIRERIQEIKREIIVAVENQ